ncbi:hypothetical protein BAUCODRAFT_120139 [Baudoinia panamericana UAMH 10762]|uniref:Uncharacterized protein n=1 Tax=Baudoinia panamericana (strain UAMH 10762) TaxID=717646 RepID=M2LW07_BAUPA|nr:uncharacterized protein BAUCODRAFT_120139 [Baudoinia panamericana UAMH 10762]EMC98847.1 hypothetical protein BAUCODRAFT_120139 [Baudoinia panamericana UAMH 10762]
MEPSEHDRVPDTTVALQSNEPLTWRAGKPIAVSDLLRRLKALYDELQPLDQGDAQRASLVPKAQELANVQLIGHKDRGVKAWSLLCIVEMFRLLAPDAPYKSGQLKQIFDLFVSTVVPSLASPTDPYRPQYIGILTSLTTVKSIVLLTDIPGSDTLVMKLFANGFDVVSGNVRGSQGERSSKNVEYHLTQLLTTLMEECATLPDGVIDVVLAQFLRADPNTVFNVGKRSDDQQSDTVRETPPAYNMARSLCSSCADRMSAAIGQYFSSVLIDTSERFSSSKVSTHRGKKRTHDESEEDDDDLQSAPNEKGIHEIEKAHRLLRELWRSSPDVVESVVPQIEAEIEAENQQLRVLAVQTIGDMVAGIGAAGPPPPVELDPAAYPSQSLEMRLLSSQSNDSMLTPAAPHAFSSVYPNAYQAFVDRHRDKSAQVRSVWALAAGRIIATSAGGKGLNGDQEGQMLRYLADLLVDQDEKVRLAAVQALALFDFNTMLQKLGKNGTQTTANPMLSNLTDRIKDPKQTVRAAAIHLLGRLWGVAEGAIAEGSERVRNVFGQIPTRLFMAMYVNDASINDSVTRTVHESLLPVAYPLVKTKPAINGNLRRGVGDAASEIREADADTLRAERILIMVRDLDEKAKKVFTSMQQQRMGKAKYLEKYLKACAAADDHNADTDTEMKAKKELDIMIPAVAKLVPRLPEATEHLKRFAAHNDKRSYQLIRFCYSPDSDYRKIIKATKELTRRLEEAPTGVAAVLESLLPLVRSASNLVYNRSHVPAIMDFARTDEKGLSAAAHELLKDISNIAPDVFKVHLQELCDSLRKRAPTPNIPSISTAVDELKACAGFARRFPEEMPKNREFYQAMSAFAKHGTPPQAAKHAITVIVAAADKCDMYVRDILKYCLTNFEYGAECFLSKLAALSQLRLVANAETDEQSDEIMAVAVTKILGNVRTKDHDKAAEWRNEIDDDLSGKLWALKILVNGLRGMRTDIDAEEAQEAIVPVATNVYKLLNTLIQHEGELSKDTATVKYHRAHLRLAAANQLLKLSCNRLFDTQLTPNDFNRLARMAQDPLPEVREGFARTLKKYLGQGKLPHRFYAIVFVFAFEPLKAVKDSTTTWLKARAAVFTKSNSTVMETVFSRLLSLLAHHPDFSTNPEDLEDVVGYIMFYLKTVATEANLPLIYHIAQRLKSVQDGIDPDVSDNLYVMSDLAEAVIRNYQDHCGWAMMQYPEKVRLPTGIFAQLHSHTMAQNIAEKRYITEKFAERIEDLVKSNLRSKKRKSDDTMQQPAKRSRAATNDPEQALAGAKKRLPLRKAPKTAKTPKKTTVAGATLSTDRRKSARASKVSTYAEESDSDMDEDMERWQDDEEEQVSSEDKDIMDVLSDSDDQLSEPPSDVEA